MVRTDFIACGLCVWLVMNGNHKGVRACLKGKSEWIALDETHKPNKTDCGESVSHRNHKRRNTRRVVFNRYIQLITDEEVEKVCWHDKINKRISRFRTHVGASRTIILWQLIFTCSTCSSESWNAVGLSNVRVCFGAFSGLYRATNVRRVSTDEHNTDLLKFRIPQHTLLIARGFGRWIDVNRRAKHKPLSMHSVASKHAN